MCERNKLGIVSMQTATAGTGLIADMFSDSSTLHWQSLLSQMETGFGQAVCGCMGDPVS